jgi:4-diphosphocytidyl-2-C-methyl-D-erythritol kinase
LTIALPARAKLNIDLEVLNGRDDGFHDIRTTIHSIELHDLLVIEPANKTAFTTDGHAISTEDNSVLAAHAAIERAARRSLPTRFHLHKRIPPGSGMGGASSDAAAALRGLKTIYGLDIDLEPIAREIGADVPYFLMGGHARAEGRGERLTRLAPHATWFVVAWPRIELSTAAVYRAWDEVNGEGPNHLRRAAEHVDPRIKDFAQELGDGWRMTGSGSAFFKESESEAKATQTANNVGGWTAVTHTVGPWA